MFRGLFAKLFVGGIAAAIVVTGIAAVSAQTVVQPAEAAAVTQLEAVASTLNVANTATGEANADRPSFAHFGRSREAYAEKRAAQQAAFAEALGITVEQLEAAQLEAKEAAVAQAVEEDVLTQEQADAILEGDRGGAVFGKWARHKMDDDQRFLADALGITVDELEAARAEAAVTMIDNAVANGDITAEEGELMKARIALSQYIDKEAVVADVLGVSTAELDAAKGDRDALAQLVEDAGLTEDEFRTEMEAAISAAIDEAVEAGVITAEQAEQIRENPLGRKGRGAQRGPRGRFGNRGGFDGPRSAPNGDSQGVSAGLEA